jgi:hypothetical protein
MFWTFKLNFEKDIFASFYLATVLATFSNIWANFFQSFGHPGAVRFSCDVKLRSGLVMGT